MDLFLRFHNHFFFTFTKGSTITKTGQSFFCLIACILSSVPLLLSTGTPQQIEKICISTEPYHKTWPNPFNLSLRPRLQFPHFYIVHISKANMPIPANAPTVLTTTTPLPIICPVCRDNNNCPKHCTNKVFTKSYEMVERELRTRSSVEQPKRAPSLSCRSEDEQWVDISNQRLKGTQMGALYPGSKFKGVQKSGKTSYEVAVKIQVG